jgi:RNA recognition motif-containing protein
MDENKLKFIFKSVSNIRIQKGADNKSKGFGYIDFTSEEALRKALEKNNTEIEGKTIRLEKANSSFNDKVYEESKQRLGKKKQRIQENKQKVKN